MDSSKTGIASLLAACLLAACQPVTYPYTPPSESEARVSTGLNSRGEAGRWHAERRAPGEATAIGGGSLPRIAVLSAKGRLNDVLWTRRGVLLRPRVETEIQGSDLRFDPPWRVHLRAQQARITAPLVPGCHWGDYSVVIDSHEDALRITLRESRVLYTRRFRNLAEACHSFAEEIRTRGVTLEVPLVTTGDGIAERLVLELLP